MFCSPLAQGAQTYMRMLSKQITSLLPCDALHPPYMSNAQCTAGRREWVQAGAGCSKLCHMQELQAIGKGGYGTVVAAINRLDGRKYAVKRIPLNAQSPASYARILREVSTLSRLQHPHVVRYFQVSPPILC